MSSLLFDMGDLQQHTAIGLQPQDQLDETPLAFNEESSLDLQLTQSADPNDFEAFTTAENLQQEEQPIQTQPFAAQNIDATYSKQHQHSCCCYTRRSPEQWTRRRPHNKA